MENGHVITSWLNPRHLQPELRPLTSREREIIGLIGAVHASKQIADAFKISINTVNNHRASILAKLGAHSAEIRGSSSKP